MAQSIVSGNAGNAMGDRGWFVGHFFPDATDPRYTGDVELKWAVHEAGTTRPVWATNATATTIVILISGQYRLHFPDQAVCLTQPGDYVLWGPQIPHTWTAEATSTVLVVRYPSTAGDSLEHESFGSPAQ